MKPTTVEGVGSHGTAIYRGWTSPAQADAVGPLPIEMDNDTGAEILEGSVVVVVGDQDQIELAGTSAIPQLIGIAVDDIDDADSGMVLFDRGPVDVILVTGAVTAGQFAVPSATPGVADPVTGWTEDAFAIFTTDGDETEGNEPEGFLFGGGMTGTGTGGGGAHTHDAEDVSLADAGGFFTATDVEAAIAELAAKDIGYQAHGNMGATETFSSLTGWHSGTFDADCTFTFSGATSGIVASMILELAEDGTGGWQPTWPGSVVWPGGSPPTHDDTAGTTTLYLMQSRDGGTTWYGFQAGGGTAVAALDDLTDVTITGPAEDDMVRYIGGVWVNTRRDREPVTDNPGTGPEIVFDGDDIVMDWSTY